MKRRLLVLFPVLLVAGTTGFIVFSGHWLRYIFAHAGGLGLMGLLGYAAAAIAARKGGHPRRAFWLAFAPPILLGCAAALVVRAWGGRGCGGIVSLAASFAVIALHGLAGSRNAG